VLYCARLVANIFPGARSVPGLSARRLGIERALLCASFRVVSSRAGKSRDIAVLRPVDLAVLREAISVPVDVRDEWPAPG
jgi:hypothetical protein